MRTGAAWRELPAEFGACKTTHDRYTRWRRDGAWARILAALLLSQGTSATELPGAFQARL
jgi:transposase